MYRWIAVFVILGCGPWFVLPAAAQVTVADICAELSASGGALPSGCADMSPAAANPAPAPMPAAVNADGSLTDTMKESHVFFPKGGSALDAAAQFQVAQLVAVLETPPLRTACLRLVGHSDASGGADINRRIAADRAEAVAAALRAGLSDPKRVAEVTSAGEDEPLVGLDPEAPEQRRVALLARRCPNMGL